MKTLWNRREKKMKEKDHTRCSYVFEKSFLSGVYVYVCVFTSPAKIRILVHKCFVIKIILHDRASVKNTTDEIISHGITTINKETKRRQITCDSCL